MTTNRSNRGASRGATLGASGSASRASASAPASGAEQLAALTAWNATALDAFSRAGKAYATGVAAFNEELASFVQSRLRQDVALGEQLMRCRSLSDAASVQTDWFKDTTQEYAAEMQKLLELGSSMMCESWAPLQASSVAPASAPGETEEDE